MTDRTAVILLATALAALVAVQIATAAGYLARRDHATWPRAITRAAVAFAAALTLSATLAETIRTLIR